MGIESDKPQLSMLRKRTEERFGKTFRVHNDFVLLASDIENITKEHISESTLERVWNYSTRGYSTISLRTLDVICAYCGFKNWEQFCKDLKENNGDSDFFDEEIISVSDLRPGQKIKIGWLPNRICILRYLGNERFMAEECENSTMQPGDSFSCGIMQHGQPLWTDDFQTADGTKIKSRYIMGLHNGLTILQILS